MKKYIFIGLILFLIVFSLGCTSRNNNNRFQGNIILYKVDKGPKFQILYDSFTKVK